MQRIALQKRVDFFAGEEESGCLYMSIKMVLKYQAVLG